MEVFSMLVQNILRKFLNRFYLLHYTRKVWACVKKIGILFEDFDHIELTGLRLFRFSWNMKLLSNNA